MAEEERNSNKIDPVAAMSAELASIKVTYPESHQAVTDKSIQVRLLWLLTPRYEP
jgi:hypothetical protein